MKKTTKRRSRYVRPDPISYRFSDNDMEILLWVYRLRYATSEMLAVLTGRDKRTIDKRCQLLWSDGKLGRLHRNKPRHIPGSVKAIHVLDKDGLKLVANELDLLNPGTSPLENVNNDGHLQHSLLVSHIQTIVRAICQRHEQIELNFWHGESQRYAELVNFEGRDYSVKPDAFFSIHFRNCAQKKQDFHFFLEADRSTMSHADMRAKFKGYLGLQQKYQKQPIARFDGIKYFRALTVIEKKSSEPVRLTNMLDDVLKVTQNQGSKLFYFAHQEDIPIDTPEQFLQALWGVALPVVDKATGKTKVVSKQSLFPLYDLMSNK